MWLIVIGMISERFRVFEFRVPLPPAERVTAFPRCSGCCAAMLAGFADGPGVVAPLPTTTASGSMFVSSARTARRPLVDELRTATGMHKSGLLTDGEFVALKAKLLANV